jgi:hypothetical protein
MVDWRAPDFDIATVGIETSYGGTLFRSRLEAHWAAFFDILRWPRWQYEPVDGSGYICDFAIPFRRGPVMIEVKPALTFDDLEAAERKMCLSGLRTDFIVVGAMLFENGPDVSFGRLRLWDKESNDGWIPADHALAHKCSSCGMVVAYHSSDDWLCLSCERRVSIHGGGASLRDDLTIAWREAANTVRWACVP